MHLFFNIALGIVPTLVLASSIAAGVADDARHRRMFLMIYGLWAVTLAMWNWMKSYPVAWVIVWGAAGLLAFVITALRRR